MSLPWKTAVQLAEKTSPDYPKKLALFEAVSLQAHPDVLEHMGESGRGIKRSAGMGRVASAVDYALILPTILLVIAPIVGLAAIMGDPMGFHRMDASMSVPIAGVSFAVSAVMQLVMAVLWWRHGRSRHSLWFIYSFGTALFAAAAWITMANASAFDGFEGWQVWRLPVLVAGVLGAAFGVLVVVRGQQPPPPAPRDPEGSVRLRDAVDAMSAAERARVLDDRNAAIAILVEKGCFTPEVGERAMRAELGTLHLLDDALKTERR